MKPKILGLLTPLVKILHARVCRRQSELATTPTVCSAQARLQATCVLASGSSGNAALLAQSRVYIGPDTSVTHLAAASGCPTVALYGPTDPRLWGPVPAAGLEPMWEAAGTIQRRGNVWLVQNPLPCLPCQNEGCERRIDSYSRCLDQLSPRKVLTAVDQALASVRADR